MSSPTITLPPPILDMLAKGVHETPKPNGYVVWQQDGKPHHILLVTDAGDELVFLRGPDMERT